MKKLFPLIIILFAVQLAFGQTFLNEDFNSNVMPPAGWTIDGVPAQWSVSASTKAGGAAPEAKFTYTNSVNTSRLISPVVNLTGNSTVTLAFKYFYDFYANGPSIGVATRFGTGDWTVAWQVTPTGNQGPKIQFVELTNVGQSDFQFCVFITGNLYNVDYWFIDNIKLYIPLNLDAALVAADVPQYVEAGAQFNLKGTISNEGITAINSFDVSYTVNGGAVQVFHVSGINLAIGATYSFTHPDQVTLPTIGSYDIVTTINNVNGSIDNYPSNNSITKMVGAVAFIPNKKVLAEEATGVWDPWSPRGTCFMNYMAETYPETWIGIAVHNNDPMVYAPYDAAIPSIIPGFIGYPQVTTDRTAGDSDPVNLEAAYLRRIAAISPATLDIVNYSYNSTTREVLFSLQSEFVVSVNSELRFGVIFVEDSLWGTTAQWNQSNAYAGGGQGPMCGFESLPSSVPVNLIHYDYVGRMILDTPFGTPESLPISITSGETITYNYTYTLPETWRYDKLSIIGFLRDHASGEILNANKKICAELNNKAEILSFTIESQNNLSTINAGNQTIEVLVNPQTDLSNLTACWTISENATITVNGTSQICNVSMNNYSNPVIFKVTAEDGISFKFWTVNVTVASNCQAGWTPLPNLQYNMQVVAQILIDGQVSLNPNDVLGAFVGEECRGIASPQPDANGLVFLTVGSDVAAGEQVELKIWNSTDCSECNAIPGFEFVNQAEVGTFLEPYQVRCGAILDLSFGQGYTWFSLNVNPGSMSPTNLFTDLTPCYDDRVIGQTSFALYTGSSWLGSLTELSMDKMYRMKLCSAQNLSLMGDAAALNPINLNAGYTWLGYQPQECQSISAAMAGLSPGPSYNDRVIGQSSFALYTGTSWIGSLTQLCPGKGYIVKLANAQSLTYPAGTSKGSPVVEAETISPTGVYPAENMQHTMMVMAQLRLPDGSISLNEKDVVYAMIDGEVRAIGHPMVGADGIIFLSIAENNEHPKPITFMVWLDERQELLPLNETLSFEPLAAVGELNDPFIFTLGEMVGVNEMTDGVWIGEPYPNPFVNSMTINIETKTKYLLSIKMYDTRGQMVFQETQEVNNTGNQKFNFQIESLKKGLFHLEIMVLNGNEYAKRYFKLVKL